MLVVNDPPLAEAIGRLRGEWTVRGGGQLEATSASWPEAESAAEVDADVIFFPARYLGALCGRGWLRPVRASVLQGRVYDAQDVLPLVRQRLIRYGGEDMALPLGIELPLVGYRQQWLVQRQGQPPRSRADFEQLVQQGDTPVWWPPRESVAHWDAMMLLARAAAYAVHPNREGVLFDPQTMAPRIGEPPFVRALEEWYRELGWLGSTRPNIVFGARSPQSRWGFAALHPSHPDADPGSLPAADEAVPVVWAEPPGSDELYNHAIGQWEAADGGVRQVPLLGGGGTLAGVTTASRNAATAFQLLAWLTGPEIGSQIGPKTAASLPCRRSQLPLVGQWFGDLPLAEGGVATGDSPWRGEGALAHNTQLARVVERALSGSACLVVPPLPGIDEYLAALDDGVQQALGGKSAPPDALNEVARRWDQITDARGREVQRRAYLSHLGIVEPALPVGRSSGPTPGTALVKAAATR